MPKVTFHPAGKSGDVPEGISLLDAAEKLGLEMRHDCGGFATCSTCRVWVIEGMPHLTEIDLDEENMLEEAELTPPYRLSCQAKIKGDVVVRVPTEEMEWSKSALRDLEEQAGPHKATIRLMVEKRAREKGIEVILPDTALPLVAEAKREIEVAAADPARLAALIKRVHEEP
ncbi:MAG TPA: 2Fe-2S iron-sulfur cluster-binding protein [Candidatus Manganitrophaceae bacterium]|nr:2Fe-2S iron-sulfur cluster-binding protein [Candidatus Manganitrophaceae bacterium]